MYIALLHHTPKERAYWGPGAAFVFSRSWLRLSWNRGEFWRKRGSRGWRRAADNAGRSFGRLGGWAFYRRHVYHVWIGCLEVSVCVRDTNANLIGPMGMSWRWPRRRDVKAAGAVR